MARCNFLNFRLKKVLQHYPYFLIIVLGLYLLFEIYGTVLPHNLMQVRYGDDLVFHNSLSELYVYFQNHNLIDFIFFIKPNFAYSSLFWFINFIATLLASIFNSQVLLTLTPFIISLSFLLIALVYIYKIYLIYFNKRSTAFLALVFFILLPIASHAGVRFHNYSMTLLLSSMLFFKLKNWQSLDLKKIVLLAILSGALISTKLNGAFIGFACLGVFFSNNNFVRAFHIKNSLSAFFVVASLISGRENPFISAILLATILTFLGQFFSAPLLLKGSGMRRGESVSSKIFSRGIFSITSTRCLAEG